MTYPPYVPTVGSCFPSFLDSRRHRSCVRSCGMFPESSPTFSFFFFLESFSFFPYPKSFPFFFSPFPKSRERTWPTTISPRRCTFGKSRWSRHRPLVGDKSQSKKPQRSPPWPFIGLLQSSLKSTSSPPVPDDGLQELVPPLPSRRVVTQSWRMVSLIFLQFDMTDRGSYVWSDFWSCGGPTPLEGDRVRRVLRPLVTWPSFNLRV